MFGSNPEIQTSITKKMDNNIDTPELTLTLLTFRHEKNGDPQQR